MVDNSTQSGADTIRDKDRAGVKTQIVGLDINISGTELLGTGTAVGTKNAVDMNIAASAGGVAAVAQTLSAAVANTPGTPVTASTTAQAVANVTLSGNGTFHIVTSAFVGTLVFEASLDSGANYAPILAIREDGTGSESQTSISTAAAFIRTYTVGIPGFTHFRVRCSAFTSGTAAVVINQGPLLIETNPSLAAGSAQIGTIGELRASTLGVTTTAAVSTAATLTLPAAAGLFHYIESLEVTLYTAIARTGSATPVLVTTTNLPGADVFDFATAAAIGTTDKQLLSFARPYRSSVVNTATTIVAPLVTGGIWRLTARYFTAA